MSADAEALRETVEGLEALVDALNAEVAELRATTVPLAEHRAKVADIKAQYSAVVGTLKDRILALSGQLSAAAEKHAAEQGPAAAATAMGESRAAFALSNELDLIKAQYSAAAARTGELEERLAGTAAAASQFREANRRLSEEVARLKEARARDLDAFNERARESAAAVDALSRQVEAQQAEAARLGRSAASLPTRERLVEDKRRCEAHLRFAEARLQYLEQRARKALDRGVATSVLSNLVSSCRALVPRQDQRRWDALMSVATSLLGDPGEPGGPGESENPQGSEHPERPEHLDGPGEKG